MLFCSQKPPKQKPVQHWASVVHAPAVGWQLTGGATHAPPVQTLVQQSAAAVQAPPVAAHGVLHTWAVASQTPRQHCAVVVQAAPCARQVSAPKPQRGGSTVS